VNACNEIITSLARPALTHLPTGTQSQFTRHQRRPAQPLSALLLLLLKLLPLQLQLVLQQAHAAAVAKHGTAMRLLCRV
jgi:hypothetical protein